MRAHTRKKGVLLLITFALFSITFYLGYRKLVASGLWTDELNTVTNAARGSIQHNWFSYRNTYSTGLTSHDSWLTAASVDDNPPLFSLLLAFWTSLFGYSETSVRLLPLIIGSLSPVITYLGLKEVDLHAGDGFVCGIDDLARERWCRSHGRCESHSE